MQRVARLQAAGQEPGLSACRCVKFGNGPADLLAYNEHCSFTHVVDARNFQQEQVDAVIELLKASQHLTQFYNTDSILAERSLSDVWTL